MKSAADIARALDGISFRPKQRFTKGRLKLMMDSMTASLKGVARRDIAIASIVTLLGLALMYINVDGHHADPAEYKRNTAIFYGGVVPYGLAIVLFPLVTVPLLWRRVAPIAAPGAALAGL